MTRLGQRQFSMIGAGAIALAVFLSGFVPFEPAPYELYLAALIPLFALLGLLRITRTNVVPLICLLSMNLGGLIAMTQMNNLAKAPLYIAVSTFLALSAVFFASLVETDGRRLRLIFNAYTCAALGTALVGILGYFGAIPNAAQFTRYGRAEGAFQDPNVFGPYLTMPAVYLMQRVLKEPLSNAPLKLAILGVLTLGVFLSFSRAAWFLYGSTMMFSIGLMLLKERSPAFRLKIITIAVVGIAGMMLVVVLALQSEKVAQLFSQRAEIVQSYDTARLGRFARHILGFEMAMEHPLGIGPLVFGPIYGEDTHNIWLKTLLDYSWLGFISYIFFMYLTLGFGFKLLLRDRPWQPYLAAAWCVFFGHIAIGNVIDTDHWRHFYMISGIIWGCIGLEYRLQRSLSGQTAPMPETATSLA